MNHFLRQATAGQDRVLGPFVDETDGWSPEAGLTINNTDVKLISNGGSVATKNSGGGTHKTNGCYAFVFDATDSATVGELHVSILVTGARIVDRVFWVLEEPVYDALFAAGTAGPALAAVCTSGRLAELDGANLPTDIAAVATAVGGLENVSAAQVKAQIDAALGTDTLAQPGQAKPPLNPTIAAAIAWLYKNFRNRGAADANEWRLYNDGGGTVDQKRVISENAGVTEREEIESGP